MTCYRKQVILATSKSELRKHYLKLRDSLDVEVRRDFSRGIFENLSSLDIFRKAKTIMTFLSIHSEVDTWDIARHVLQANKQLSVPVINWNKKEMFASRLQNLDTDLISVRYQLWEPYPDAVDPIERDEIDLILVPGAAWNDAGFRIGYGGGFYDRFLRGKSNSVKTVGLTFSCQTAAEFEVQEWDEPVDYILTEEKLNACNS